MKKKIKVSITCPATWIQNGTNRYLIVNSNKNFKDAQTDCISKSANLVTIGDQNELDFIKRISSANFATIWVQVIFKLKKKLYIFYCNYYLDGLYCI